MTFEIYSPTMRITTIGMWKTKGDTLICTPYLDYAVEKGKLYTENLSRHHKNSDIYTQTLSNKRKYITRHHRLPSNIS